MPSIGSTIQITPLVPARSLPSSPTMPSSGRASRSRSTDQHLAGSVGLGDDVDRAGLRARHLDALAAQPDDQLARLARGDQGEVEQVVRCRSRHAPAPDAWGELTRRQLAEGRQRGARVGAAVRRAPVPRSPASRRRPARSTVSPRSTAARSSSRSRTIATNRASVPGVRHPYGVEAQPLGGRHRLGVEVVDDLHVVRDEADRDQHDRTHPFARETLEVVVDVGLEPRHLGRSGARAEDEVVVEPPAGDLGDPAATYAAASRCWAR